MISRLVVCVPRRYSMADLYTSYSTSYGSAVYLPKNSHILYVCVLPRWGLMLLPQLQVHGVQWNEWQRSPCFHFGSAPPLQNYGNCCKNFPRSLISSALVFDWEQGSAARHTHTHIKQNREETGEVTLHLQRYLWEKKAWMLPSG